MTVAASSASSACEGKDEPDSDIEEIAEVLDLADFLKRFAGGGALTLDDVLPEGAFEAVV